MATHKRLSTIDPDSPMMTPIDESNGGSYNMSQIGLEEEDDENITQNITQSGSDGRFAAARIRVDDGPSAGQYDGATGERIGEGRYHPKTGFPFLKPRTSLLPTSILHLKNPTVHIGARIRKISLLSESDMTFFCRFTLFLNWTDPRTVGLPPNTYVGVPAVGEGASCVERQRHREETGDMSFSPLLRFFGSTEAEFLTDTPLQPKTVDSNGSMKLIISGSATFDQEYELRKFPFDLQALRIIVRLQNEEDGVELRRMPMSLDGSTSVVFDEYFSIAEFAILRPFIDVSYHGKTEYGTTAKPKSEFTVVVPVKRAYGSYVNHVAAVTFMITTSTFTSFCVPPDSLADRMSIVLTLFLTIVATKFLIMERLPRVAFNTYLDLYFSGCFGFFVLVIVESVFVSLLAGGHIIGDPAVLLIDRICSWVIAALWVMFNFVALRLSERVLREADGDHISRAWIPAGLTQREAMVNGRPTSNPKTLWIFKS